MAAHIRRRPVLAGIIAVLLVVVLLVGGRAAWRLADRLLGPPPPPRQTDVSLIADWMSVPYISRVYRVPRQELYRALGSEADGRDRRPLREWAQVQGRTSDETVRIVQETVQAWQASHPEPPRPSPPPNAPPPPVLAPPKPDEPQPPSPIPSPAALRGAEHDILGMVNPSEGSLRPYPVIPSEGSLRPKSRDLTAWSSAHLREIPPLRSQARSGRDDGQNVQARSGRDDGQASDRQLSQSRLLVTASG